MESAIEKQKWITLFSMAALLFAGCVATSVYPFYEDRDLVFGPALLGKWQYTTGEEGTWHVEKKGKGYRITVATSVETNVMEGFSFTLRGQPFLDLCGARWEEEIVPEPVPSHMLLRVLRADSRMELRPLDYEWLRKQLEQKPDALRHIVLKDSETGKSTRLVLTANTRTLQRFVLKHLNNTNAGTARS